MAHIILRRTSSEVVLVLALRIQADQTFLEMVQEKMRLTQVFLHLLVLKLV